MLAHPISLPVWSLNPAGFCPPPEKHSGPGHPRFCELRLPSPLTRHAALCSWKLSPSAGCPVFCPLTGTFSDPGHPRLLSLRPHRSVLSLCPVLLSSVPMRVTLLGLCATMSLGDCRWRVSPSWPAGLHPFCYWHTSIWAHT